MKTFLPTLPVVVLLASGPTLHAQLPSATPKKAKKNVETVVPPPPLEEDVVIDVRPFNAPVPPPPPGAPHPPTTPPGINPDQVVRQIEGAMRSAFDAVGEHSDQLKDQIRALVRDQLDAAAQGLGISAIQRSLAPTAIPTTTAKMT